MKAEATQPSGYTLEEEREAERLAIASTLGISEWPSFLPMARANLTRDAASPATEDGATARPHQFRPTSPGSSMCEDCPYIPGSSIHTARKETDWYVDRRPLDVLLPHVPGFEVDSDEDAEWKCIARNQEIGQQISDAVNSYTASQKRIEALEAALGRLAVDILQEHYDDAREFVQALAITSAPDCTPRAALKGDS